MWVLELSDAYRKVQELGGFTWSREKIYSRLDYVLMSINLILYIDKADTDWAFDESNHEAVKINLKIPNVKPKGPGLVSQYKDLKKTYWYIKKNCFVKEAK